MTITRPKLWGTHNGTFETLHSKDLAWLLKRRNKDCIFDSLHTSLAGPDADPLSSLFFNDFKNQLRSTNSGYIPNFANPPKPLLDDLQVANVLNVYKKADLGVSPF
jgi:hypothetical protein